MGNTLDGLGRKKKRMRIVKNCGRGFEMMLQQRVEMEKREREDDRLRKWGFYVTDNPRALMLGHMYAVI